MWAQMWPSGEVSMTIDDPVAGFTFNVIYLTPLLPYRYSHKASCARLG